MEGQFWELFHKKLECNFVQILKLYFVIFYTDVLKIFTIFYVLEQILKPENVFGVLAALAH